MSRAVTLTVLGAALLVAAVLATVLLTVRSWHRDSEGGPPAEASPSTPTVVLTAERPTAQVPQPRRPDATVIQLKVDSLSNPTRQGLVLTVAVQDSAASAPAIDVGSVSPYPADQPGVFTLALHGPAAELVQRGPTVLVLAVSAPPDTPLEAGVRLSITATATQM